MMWKRTIVGVLGVLMLAGCQHASQQPYHEAPADIRVMLADHVVQFNAEDSSVLLPEETEALWYFIGSIKPTTVRDVTLVGNKSDPLFFARARTVREQWLRAGVQKSRIQAVQLQRPDDASRMHVHVRYSAVYYDRACPDWSKPAQHNFFNTPHSNFACATRHNLALQLADPMDMRVSHTDTHISNQRTQVIMERYHNVESFSAGNAADVNGLVDE